MALPPPDPGQFEQRVWEFVRRVPLGKVVTYGRVAEEIGAPSGVDDETYKTYGARWVGSAMAGSPADVPWQRVVNAQGRISIRKGTLHLRQKALLVAEGVEFDARDRIDLDRFEWNAGKPQQKALW
jgi:methylated-DNA-protein-cysteine methyltransferase-like protein